MKEEEIRPADLHETYLELSKIDAQAFFPSSMDRHDLPCPACDNNETVKQFEKDGFGYTCCNSCGTLYQSPRPPQKAFERFYEDSPSSNYWAETFYPQVAEARRELIFKLRVEVITEYCRKKHIPHKYVIDVGAGYGIFLEEWRIRHPKDSVMAIEPGEILAKICRNKGIDTFETVAENTDVLAGKADLTTCFEVIEHVYSPIDFLRSLIKMTRPGGYVLISGLGVDGYDIQVLWEHSKSISPPHHINFMSVKGYKSLFTRVGFIDVDVFTPGKLDVEIVSKEILQKPELAANNRFAAMLAVRGHQAQHEFQNFLKKYHMSSHVWVVAKRPNLV